MTERHAADWHSPDSGPTDSRAVDEGVARTAAAIIGLNVLLQVGVYIWSRATHVEPATGIRIALYLAAGFYGLSYALIAARVKRLDLRPVWIRPGTVRHAQLGLAVGIGAWLAVVGLGFLATHHVTKDPSAELMVAGAGVGRVLLAFGLLAMLGPWIEELLFRGLVLESLRYRGTKKAVVVSSILFAMAHLRPGIVYYSAMGAVFGVVYLNRGLKASFFAHAAFNACIVLTSVAAAIGPARIVSRDAMTVRLPHTWHVVVDATAPRGAIVARGPSGAELILAREILPPAARVDILRIANAFQSGAVPLPRGMTIASRSTREMDVPAGPAILVDARIQHHAAKFVLLPHGNQIVTAMLITAGSSEALHDFDGILGSLRLSA